MIYVISYNFKAPDNAVVINTTSRSTNWSRELSPFLCGPCNLYNDYISQNFENAWQYSKVYKHYLEDDGSIGEKYFSWAKNGWNSKRAERYPVGKGVKPLFSYWDGQKYDYIAARKKIYIPLYAKAVKQTLAFKKLLELYKSEQDLYLKDFDAHNLTPGNFNYSDLWDNDKIKVGHAYVLAMMLDNII